jgi:hypothetical protein
VWEEIRILPTNTFFSPNTTNLTISIDNFNEELVIFGNISEFFLEVYDETTIDLYNLLILPPTWENITLQGIAGMRKYLENISNRYFEYSLLFAFDEFVAFLQPYSESYFATVVISFRQILLVERWDEPALASLAILQEFYDQTWYFLLEDLFFLRDLISPNEFISSFKYWILPTARTLYDLEEIRNDCISKGLQVVIYNVFRFDKISSGEP